MMHRGRRFALTGEGALTLASDSLAATQGIVRAQFAIASWATSDIEASATSIGITMPGTNGNRSFLVRQHAQLGALRMFASAGAGNTSRNQLNSHSTVQQFGVTATRNVFGDALSLSTTAQRATTDDWQLMEAAGFSLRSPSDWYGMHDAVAELLWQSPRIAISVTQSWRAGFGATRGTGSAASITASWQVSAPLTLIVQSGRQLADPLRGVPQASYMGLAMRLQLGRASIMRAASLRDAARRRAGGVASTGQLTVFEQIEGAEYRLERREGGAELVMRVDAASDASVEVACSATEWAPIRLVRAGDAFVARIPLASGAHRVAIRVNGGEWRTPRGLSRVNDDFGGSAGLLIVP